MRKLQLIFFTGLLISLESFSLGHVTVILNLKNTTENYSMSIYEPIDGGYNFLIKSKEHLFNSNDRTYKYSYSPTTPAMVLYQINNRSFYLLLSGKDSVVVNIDPNLDSPDWLQFSGANAGGLKWYNDWFYIPYKNWNLGGIFDAGKKDYHHIYEQIEKYADSCAASVDLLKKKYALTNDFSHLAKKDILSAIYSDAIEKFNFILSGSKYGKVPASDSAVITQACYAIYKKFPGDADGILATMHGWSYTGRYVNASGSKPGTSAAWEAFGPSYKQYNTLPDGLVKPLLGQAIVISYLYATNDFNKSVAITQFRKKFPNSEYLPIIDALSGRENAAADKTSDELAAYIHVDTSAQIAAIKTLQEFHHTYFKGKKIFIDMWATWCKPCLTEFAHTEKLDSIAALHDVALVFLSIDEQNFFEKWKRDINFFKLKGFHFRGNQTLMNNIRKNIYGNDVFAIPRYIFMNEEGQVVEKDAPRPSSVNKLEKLFSR